MAPNYDQESKFYANSNLGLSRMIEQEYRKSKPLPWGGAHKPDRTTGGLYQGGQGRQGIQCMREESVYLMCS